MRNMEISPKNHVGIEFAILQFEMLRHLIGYRILSHIGNLGPRL